MVWHQILLVDLYYLYLKKKKKKVEQSSTTVCKCFYIMFERLDATSQARPAALH